MQKPEVPFYAVPALFRTHAHLVRQAYSARRATGRTMGKLSKLGHLTLVCMWMAPICHSFLPQLPLTHSSTSNSTVCASGSPSLPLVSPFASPIPHRHPYPTPSAAPIPTPPLPLTLHLPMLLCQPLPLPIPLSTLLLSLFLPLPFPLSLPHPPSPPTP